MFCFLSLIYWVNGGFDIEQKGKERKGKLSSISNCSCSPKSSCWCKLSGKECEMQTMDSDTGKKTIAFSIDSILNGTFERCNESSAEKNKDCLDLKFGATTNSVDLKHVCMCCCYCSHCGEMLQTDYLPAMCKN